MSNAKIFTNKYKSVFQKRFIDIVGEKTPHIEIANRIKETTNVDISRPTVDSWINGKFKPNAECLIAISKTYNVSVDYLLGTSDIRNIDPTVKMICEFTGLDSVCVIDLNRKKDVDKNNVYSDVVSAMLNDDYFKQIIMNIVTSLAYSGKHTEAPYNDQREIEAFVCKHEEFLNSHDVNVYPNDVLRIMLENNSKEAFSQAYNQVISILSAKGSG